MEPHLSGEEIDRMLHKTMRAEEVLVAARHLGSCRECRDRFATTLPKAIFPIATEEPAHIDLDGLSAYRAGTSSPADREIVASHLEQCATCREDLSDIADASVPARSMAWIAVAAAAVVAMVAIGLMVSTPRTPAPSLRTVNVAKATKPAAATPAYERAEWTELIASVMRDRALPQRDLRDLRPGPDSLRGRPESSIGSVEPQGVVVETVRPHLRWPHVPNAKSVVSLQRVGSSEVLRSPTLTANEWTPGFDLERGAVYEWQVAVETDAGRSIVPAPPAPRALFRVLEAKRADAIAAARRDHPRDHLLLAALYAGSGLEAESLAELELLRADPARADLAKALIHASKSRQ